MARMHLTILLVFSCLHLAFSLPPCASKDDMGSSLASSSDSQNGFICTYEEAGVCNYFLCEYLSRYSAGYGRSGRAEISFLYSVGYGRRGRAEISFPRVGPFIMNDVSSPVHKPTNVSIIAASALGATVVIAAVIGALIIIQRRRRRRMLNLNISRYEPSRTGNTGIQPAIFTRKQYRNIDDSTENIDESSGVTHDRQIQSEKDPAAFNPVTFPQGQIADSEAVLNDTSPQFTRALMTENIRLNAENQALRDLNRSDWTRGLTDASLPRPVLINSRKPQRVTDRTLPGPVSKSPSHEHYGGEQRNIWNQ
ncbi:hypothetical protein C8J56DRAFT_1072806 [Mycena floridula]|nr:hypothetical protein C8J56DRAFT_1072806 [Mycena floridula]